MVTEFFRGLLNAADPTIEGGRKNITVLEALDWSRRQLDQLDAQPQVKAYLHFTLGITFENLSDYTKAEEQLRGALALARQGQGISASDFIWAETGVAGVLTRIGKDWEEAEGLYRDAVARTRKLGRSANPQLVHVAVGQYGYLLWKRHGHSRQAEAQMREAVDLARTSPAISRTWVVIGDYEFAQYLIEENRDAEAAKLLTEALSVERGFSRPTSTLGPVLSTLGSLRLKQGDLAGAEEYQRQYRDEMLRQVGPNHAYSVDALANWAVAESRLGHAAEAAEASRSALDTGRRLFPAGGQNLWPPLFARASVLNDEGRFKDAEALARESLQCLPSKNEQDPRLAQSWGEIGIALLGEKRSAEAIPALETSERIFLAIRGWGTGHPNTTRVRQAQSRARAGTSQN
jgi:tetratricopeptide (TPR) repeat protein